MICPEESKIEENIIDSDMALNDVLGQISGQIQVGRRQEIFWIVIGSIAAVTLVAIQIFRKPKKRR